MERRGMRSLLAFRIVKVRGVEANIGLLKPFNVKSTDCSIERERWEGEKM